MFIYIRGAGGSLKPRLLSGIPGSGSRKSWLYWVFGARRRQNLEIYRVFGLGVTKTAAFT